MTHDPMEQAFGALVTKFCQSTDPETAPHDARLVFEHLGALERESKMQRARALLARSADVAQMLVDMVRTSNGLRNVGTTAQTFGNEVVQSNLSMSVGLFWSHRAALLQDLAPAKCKPEHVDSFVLALEEFDLLLEREIARWEAETGMQRTPEHLPAAPYAPPDDIPTPADVYARLRAIEDAAEKLLEQAIPNQSYPNACEPFAARERWMALARAFYGDSEPAYRFDPAPTPAPSTPKVSDTDPPPSNTEVTLAPTDSGSLPV